MRPLLPFVDQLYAFAMTIAAGMAAGLLFDMYRLVRRGLKPRGTGAWLLDLMFWLVAAPVVFALLLVGNWGELRFYVVVGLVAGATFYFGLLSGVMIHLIAAVAASVGGAILLVGHLLVHVVMVPVAAGRRIAEAVGARPGWRRSPWRGWGRPWGPVGPWRAFGRRV